MFCHHAVFSIEQWSLTWNITNWTEGIHDKVSLLAARSMQLEWWREVINAAIQNLKQLKDANKWYFNLTANFRAEDRHTDDWALLHQINREQSYSSELDARW
jgi:hypothetical protein